MRVLNVNHSLDPIHGGGTAERTFQMSRCLSRSGLTCTILTTETGSPSRRIKALEEVDVIALPLLSDRFYVPRVSRSTLERLVGDADIVHLMGHWTILNAAVYLTARR